MYTCADSCWGLTENNKILQSIYPSIKKINTLRKNRSSMTVRSKTE